MEWAHTRPFPLEWSNREPAAIIPIKNHKCQQDQSSQSRHHEQRRRRRFGLRKLNPFLRHSCIGSSSKETLLSCMKASNSRTQSSSIAIVSTNATNSACETKYTKSVWAQAELVLVWMTPSKNNGKVAEKRLQTTLSTTLTLKTPYCTHNSTSS